LNCQEQCHFFLTAVLSNLLMHCTRFKKRNVVREQRERGCKVMQSHAPTLLVTCKAGA
jgi:hypothetical protein